MYGDQHTIGSALGPGNVLMTEMMQCYPGTHGQYGLLTSLEFRWFGIYVGYKVPLYELNEHIKIIT